MISFMYIDYLSNEVRINQILHIESVHGTPENSLR